MRSHVCRLVVLVALILSGCPLTRSPVDPPPIADASDQPLEKLVARTLRDNLQNRTLSSEKHGAWQILHGVLAYGDAFTIETPQGDQSALRWLLDGRRVDGFEPLPGDSLGSPPQPGLRMAMQPSTKIGQGHRDQWLAIFAQSGLPLETELGSADHQYTLEDWLRQAEYDLPRNLELEFSWSLIPLTIYRGTDHRWVARDQVQYSVEDLVRSELQQNIAGSVCGGTHRLIGLAMAVDRRRQERKPLTGVWEQANRMLTDHVTLAQQNQNPDGSYSVAYMHRPGWTRDLGEVLGTTGHVLEFLAFAAPRETLSEPWVQRSVRRLCQVLDQCRDVDLECGVLYHALHGLSEYQRRMNWEMNWET